MQIRYAFYPIDYGILKIGCTHSALTFLKCVKSIDEPQCPSPLSDTVFAQIREYMDGKRKNFDFPFELHGTEFQVKVWHALCDIPYGETRTYKEIANTIGHPTAYRAVGMANHDNPIWIVVPCHRVVGSNGKLTGYAGGLEMKDALLRLEQGQGSDSRLALGR